MVVLKKIIRIMKDVLVIVILFAVCTVLFLFLREQYHFDTGDYAKAKVVEDEILRRTGIIGEQGEVINLFEVTPFVWDTSVAYFGYYGQDSFDQLIKDLDYTVTYRQTIDVGERKMFFNNNDLVFDSLWEAAIDWYIYDNAQKFQNAYVLEIQNAWYRYEGDGVFILVKEGELDDYYDNKNSIRHYRVRLVRLKCACF